MALCSGNNGLYKWNNHIMVIIQIIITIIGLICTLQTKAQVVTYVSQKVRSNTVFNEVFNAPAVLKTQEKAALEGELLPRGSNFVYNGTEKTYTVPKGATGGTVEVTTSISDSIVATIVTSPEAAVAETILEFSTASMGVAVASAAAAFGLGIGMGMYLETKGEIKEALNYQPVTTVDMTDIIIDLTNIKDDEEHQNTPDEKAKYCAKSDVYTGNKMVCSRSVGDACKEAARIKYGSVQTVTGITVTSAWGGECRMAYRTPNSPTQKIGSVKYEYQVPYTPLPVEATNVANPIFNKTKTMDGVKTNTTAERINDDTWEVRTEIENTNIGESETTIKDIKTIDQEGNLIKESLSYDTQTTPKVNTQTNTLTVTTPTNATVPQPQTNIIVQPKFKEKIVVINNPGTGTGTGTKIEWKCGIEGKPACVIMGDPKAKTEEDVNISDGEIKNILIALIPKPLETEQEILPKHGKECPKITFDFTGVFSNGFLKKKLESNINCELLEKHEKEIEKITTIGWLIIAIIITISA